MYHVSIMVLIEALMRKDHISYIHYGFGRSNVVTITGRCSGPPGYANAWTVRKL